MAKRLTIFVLVIFISPQLLGAKSARKKLLPDGFTLNGIDGKLKVKLTDGFLNLIQT
ncbi:MAG: hypothetical protein ACYS0I_07610 [Planctomycetota bacterium]